MHNDYLKKYADRYRVFQNEDMVWELATRFKCDELGMEYSVYQFSDTHLAAMLPPQTGRSLAKRFPDTLRIHQNAQDGVSLIFGEGKLHDVADLLKIRRKRKGPEVTPELLARLDANTRAHRFKVEVQNEETDFKPPISLNATSDTPPEYGGQE